MIWIVRLWPCGFGFAEKPAMFVLDLIQLMKGKRFSTVDREIRGYLPEFPFSLTHLVPPQNSCRLSMMVTFRVTRMRDCSVRRSIRAQGGGAVVAAGERASGRGGTRDWGVGCRLRKGVERMRRPGLPGGGPGRRAPESKR